MSVKEAQGLRVPGFLLEEGVVDYKFSIAREALTKEFDIVLLT